MKAFFFALRKNKQQFYKSNGGNKMPKLIPLFKAERRVEFSVSKLMFDMKIRSTRSLLSDYIFH